MGKPNRPVDGRAGEPAERMSRPRGESERSPRAWRRCARAATTPPVENFRSRARQLTPSAVWKNMSAEGPFGQAKRLFVGEPIPSHLAHHERLSRFTGL